MGRTAETILAEAAKRELLPTSLSSAEIRTQVAKELRQRALFSARCTQVHFLADLANVLDAYLAGKINLADARLRLIGSLRSLGYDPATGFAGHAGKVPPALRGTLRDLSSAKRLNLILDTQKELVYSAAQEKKGLQGVELERYPAWELVRTARRDVPRGYRKTAAGLIPVAGDSWPERWTFCGGTLYEGDRMIALKTDTIWELLGSSANFSDALDVSRPPFAFNSGYNWIPVRYDECDELGIDYSGQREPSDNEGADSSGFMFTGEPPRTGMESVPTDLLLAAQKYLRGRRAGKTFVMKGGAE